MDKETMIKNVENLFGKNSVSAYHMKRVCHNYTKDFCEICYNEIIRQKTISELLRIKRELK